MPTTSDHQFQKAVIAKVIKALSDKAKTAPVFRLALSVVEEHLDQAIDAGLLDVVFQQLKDDLTKKPAA